MLRGTISKKKKRVVKRQKKRDESEGIRREERKIGGSERGQSNWKMKRNVRALAQLNN